MNRYFTFAVLVATLAASAASGQWLEKFIWLPDTMCGIEEPNKMLVVPSESTVFLVMAGEDPHPGLFAHHLVFNGYTGRKVAKVPLPSPVGDLCYCPVTNKVYVSGWFHDTLFAVDAHSNQRTGHVLLGGPAVSLAYSPAANRIYCAIPTLRQVAVVDCGSDSVIARVGLWDEPWLVRSAPEVNKIYCALQGGDSALAVITTEDDSVSAPPGFDDMSLDDMLYNAANRTLYCIDVYHVRMGIMSCDHDSVRTWLAGIGDLRTCVGAHGERVYASSYDESRLYVVSAGSDSVVDTVETVNEPRTMAYDSVDNLLYLSDGPCVVRVLDCATNRLIDSIWVGNEEEENCPVFGYDRSLNRMYVLTLDLIMMDAGTHGILSRTELWYSACEIAHSPVSGKLYTSGELSSLTEALYVLDDSSYSITAVLDHVADPHTLLYIPGENKLYCSDSGRRICVRDCASDSIVTWIDGSFRSEGMAYSSVGNKLYLSGDSVIRVVDCAGDTHLPPVRLSQNEGPRNMSYCPTHNTVYTGTGSVEPGYALIIDGYADTVLARLELVGPPKVWCYVSSRDFMCCIMGIDYGLVTAIDATTNHVAGTVAVGTNPTALAYSPRSNKLFVGNYGDATVTVIDCATMVPVATFAVDIFPNWFVCDTIADIVYLVHGYYGPVSIIDARTNRVTATIGTGIGTRPPVWSSATRCLYVPALGSSVTVIKDTAVAGISSSPAAVPRHAASASLVRGVLVLPSAAGVERQASSVLLDISGRKVLDLLPGPNDVRHLAPGVYFVREPSAADGKPSAIDKVIVTR